jgi:TonB family protein
MDANLCGTQVAESRGMGIGPAVEPFRRAALAALLLVTPLAVFAATNSFSHRDLQLLERRDTRLSPLLSRASHFADIPHLSEQEVCEQVQLPVPLATPDPLSIPAAHGKKVAVSFIIGTDGRVHSPLVLESAGVPGDRRVLQTVRTWRYRPGTCNGVPTDTEGKIEFSVR